MSGDAWRPTATRTRLELRARLLAQVRGFFAERGVLEVDTPALVNHPVSDVHIHSAQVDLGVARPFFLHTSPEYAMKRLLAAGSGDIFQICHVVRGFEQSRLHNAEFTLIEWYRCGVSLEDLMSEVGALLRELLGAGAGEADLRLSYREAFLRELELDPLAASLEELQGAAQHSDPERDTLLDLLMATRVGPRLGHDAPTFIYGYPASQAALARLDPRDPRTAQRFELYGRGIELANGFHELCEPGEQRRRFEHDQSERRQRGLPVFPLDEHLLAALEAGLPDCCGVAVGFDRLLMLAARATHIDEIMAFPIDRA